MKALGAGCTPADLTSLMAKPIWRLQIASGKLGLALNGRTAIIQTLVIVACEKAGLGPW